MGMIINELRYNVIADRISKAGIGSVAEIGVAGGGVVKRIAKQFPTRTVYAYDTFEGMPQTKWVEGEKHKVGEFCFAGTEERLRQFSNVVVRKGVFPDTLGDEKGFVVVHLDVDWYTSTKDSLEAILPRMAKGGRIILDDWEWCACPGVKRAVLELGLNAIQTVDYQAEIVV